MIVSKQVMKDGMSNLVFVLYSNALASLILLPASFLFHRYIHRPAIIPSSSSTSFISFLISFYVVADQYALLSPSLFSPDFSCLLYWGYVISSFMYMFMVIMTWVCDFSQESFFRRWFLCSCFAQIFGYAGINYSSPILGTTMLNIIPAITFLLAIIFRFFSLLTVTES